MPKLAVGSETRSHWVTGMITHTGGRGDAPDFHWLMIDAWCRCKPEVVLADAGYTRRRTTSWRESGWASRRGSKQRSVGRRTSQPPIVIEDTCNANSEAHKQANPTANALKPRRPSA
ncbi:MAG: hypothetical protein AB8C95_12950 [Phycisphaeraceae bacterium]